MARDTDILLYERSEFARGMGLSPATITKALKTGRLVIDRKTDKIDPTYPTNLAYIQRVNNGNYGIGLTPEFKAQLKASFVDVDKRRRRGKVAGVGATSKVAQNYRDIAGRLDEEVSIETPEGEDLFDTLMEQGLLNPGEQLKIAQTSLANLRIAKEMDDLVVKEMVIRCFTRLNGIMSSRLLCLGQRSARGLCAIFGDMSGEKEIAVQKALDDEVAAAVDAIQREMADVIDW